MYRPISLFVVLVLAGCATGEHRPDEVRDVHSFARPDQVAVRHLALDVTVDFEARKIRGRATLDLDNRTGARELWLDTNGLDIAGVGTGDEELPYRLGPEVEYLGRALIVEIEPATDTVWVDYASRPEATALQWLEPELTAGKRHPFLLTQSQSIFARTWIPCQDSPSVRMTYEATVRVPPGLMALMSAENPTEVAPDGIYHFRMPQPIPAYLLALAVGDVAFRPLGPTTGIYAEPPVLERAAWEFAETQKMIEVAEALYGPYRWGRYDLIVLPPSFPFGGMENPRLSFITPTLIAGDRSLVATVAHELAHSWSGNLVTNATWDDFWLNEGFTVYLERRILESLHGRDHAEMLALLGYQDLLLSFEELGEDGPDTRLHIDLDGRDPEDGFTDVAYDKGYMFLRMLEEAFGRDSWDRFLAAYFDRFAFQSMTSAKFLAHLREQLISNRTDAEALERDLRLDAWVYGPGLPQNAPTIRSPAFDQVEGQLRAWVDGLAAADLRTEGWTTHHRLHFIRNLPSSVTVERLAELDRTFGFSDSGNAEILHAWLLQAVTHAYGPAEPVLERFLTGMGRLKFLEPLYSRLAETAEGLARAREIYREARPSYHPVSREAIDRILARDGGS